jgi:UDP-glucose:(heptosyl)LPS alpha-1,3-glucosyltransferase
MKLALCLFHYFPYGGLQRDFLRIATMCHEKGHEVHVFTMAFDGKKPHWMKLHLIEKRGLTNALQCKRYVSAVLSQIAGGFDRVIGFNKMPGLDVYYAADGCFAVRPKYTSFPWLKYLPRYQTYRSLEAGVFGPASQTTCLLIAEKTLREYQQVYKTPDTRLHLLPPGISQDRVAPSDFRRCREKMRKRFKIKDDQFMLLAIASRFHTKGVDRSLKALSRLPKDLQARCQFFVIGDDRFKPYLKLAKATKVNVKFVGSKDNIPDYLFAADLLLHPARNENTGTVILEALVSGLPVLTTDICGYAPYVLQAKAGSVMTSPFLVGQMASRLNDLLDHDDLEEMRKNALFFGQTADVFSLFDQAIKLIEDDTNRA